MPDISDDKKVVTTYPPREVYEDWKAHADGLDMTISQFVIRMVSAGRENIDMAPEAERWIDKLQTENRKLWNEISGLRNRIDSPEPATTDHPTTSGDAVSPLAESVREETPLSFGSKKGIVPPERFSGYYGAPDSSELERRVASNETFIKPKIGDLEAMRFYLGLEKQAVAEGIGVVRETYYHWLNKGKRIGDKSRGKAVTFLTDVWADAEYRSKFVDHCEPENPSYDGTARVAILRHLCDLTSVPVSARSRGARLNKHELGYVYGALTGDYQTPVHAAQYGQLHELIVDVVGLGRDSIGSTHPGRLKVEALLAIQERLMECRCGHPAINAIDRFSSPNPRPHN